MVFMYMIYVCYAIYGLCSSLIGSIWPEMSKELNIDASFIGMIVMNMSIAAGISSFVTYKIRQKIGSNYTNVTGLVFYATSMVIFANARNLSMLIIAPIFLGIANGLIDVNSNSYMVKAYDAKWVSFMHAVWGMAASLGPMVMTFALMYTSSYRNGFYFSVLLIIVTIIVLVLMKAWWVKARQTLDKDFVALHSVTEEEKSGDVSAREVLKIKGALPMLLCFTLSNGSGYAISAWITTLVVAQKSVSVLVGTTASTISFLALMAGRIFIGIVAKSVGIERIIKVLSFIEAIAILMLFLPYNNIILLYINVALIGFLQGPLIPLLNVSIKDIFDKKVLSVFISLGGVFGLIGIAIISALMSMASNVISINNVHIIPALGFAILFILYCNATKEVK